MNKNGKKPEAVTHACAHTLCNLEERAITLISLIITIIVLLILAGVALNFTIGENGILKHAEFSREKYQNSAEKEENELAQINNEIDYNIQSVRGDNIIDYEYEYTIAQTNINSQGSIETTLTAEYDGLAKIYHYQPSENIVSCTITRNSREVTIYYDYFTKCRSYFIPIKKGDIIKATTSGNTTAGSVIISIFPKIKDE